MTIHHPADPFLSLDTKSLPLVSQLVNPYKTAVFMPIWGLFEGLPERNSVKIASFELISVRNEVFCPRFPKKCDCLVRFGLSEVVEHHPGQNCVTIRQNVRGYVTFPDLRVPWDQVKGPVPHRPGPFDVLNPVQVTRTRVVEGADVVLVTDFR